MRRHRGPAPEDVSFFDPKRAALLREAVSDLTWLLRRHYSHKAATELVGNRYQLTQRERYALVHAAWERKSRRAPADEERIKNGRLHIDGFNLIITLETALAGGVIIHCVDGCYRDIAGVHGGYTLRTETEEAVVMAIDAIEDLGAAETLWLFDRPVSNSGRIANLLNEKASDRAVNMHARTADRVDARLKASRDIVVTADSAILDSGVEWLDLAGRIIESGLGKRANIIDLSLI